MPPSSAPQLLSLSPPSRPFLLPQHHPGLVTPPALGLRPKAEVGVGGTRGGSSAHSLPLTGPSQASGRGALSPLPLPHQPPRGSCPVHPLESPRPCLVRGEGGTTVSGPSKLPFPASPSTGCCGKAPTRALAWAPLPAKGGRRPAGHGPRTPQAVCPSRRVPVPRRSCSPVTAPRLICFIRSHL